MIDNYKKIQSKLIVDSYFTKWKLKTNQLVSEEYKEKNAIKFYNNRLQTKLFTGWKVYLKFRLHKKLLQNQANWFLEMRLKTEFYFKWSVKYQNELNQREKNEKALLLWSINIQKNCFLAWLEWHREKKKKQSRYKQALEYRQNHILKECARKFLIYSMDSKTRRLNATRLLKQKYLLSTVELESKYFYIWLNKCKFKNRLIKHVSKINQIPTIGSIKVDTSLEKREKITGNLNIQNFVDLKSKNRPAPRKPAFLIESIDCSNKITETFEEKKTGSGVKFDINEDIIIEQTPLISPTSIIVNENLVLLPPTVFAAKSIISPDSLKRTNIQNIPKQTTNNDLKSYRSPSVSTIGKEEVYLELEMKKINSNPNLLVMGCNSTTSLTSEKNLRNKNTKNELELVDLKKRLENLSIKSDKLKRLKEQEKLLLNCIKSSEINQTSMCETIYKERDQVQAEIQELSKFLKAEKIQVNELLKRYKLT